jgi:serpin B
MLSLGVALGCGANPIEDPGPPPPEWTAAGDAVVAANNRFAFDLYGQLAEKPGNLFFSPFSGHAALTMTAAGARNETLAEMRKVLHLPDDRVTDAGYGQLLPRVNGAGVAPSARGYELRTANAVWAQKGMSWQPEFQARLAGYGTGAFREADFPANPEAERKRVNDWAEQETSGRIKDLVPRGAINRTTRMVLGNAVYFKGEWQARFDPKRTYPRPFKLADGTTKDIPMMFREGDFRYYAAPDRDAQGEPEFQVAEVPYKGDQVSMVILLPRKPDGLAALAKKVTPDLLSRWLSQAVEAKETPLGLPKLRIETESVSWKEPLVKLGMPSAFADGQADFSGMTGAPNLCIADVFHKAFVDVNEEGTEAAAATAVIMREVAAPVVMDRFIADRPFLFLIRHKPTNAILFVGRFEKP